MCPDKHRFEQCLCTWQAMRKTLCHVKIFDRWVYDVSETSRGILKILLIYFNSFISPTTVFSSLDYFFPARFRRKRFSLLVVDQPLQTAQKFEYVSFELSITDTIYQHAAFQQTKCLLAILRSTAFNFLFGCRFILLYIEPRKTKLDELISRRQDA